MIFRKSSLAVIAAAFVLSACGAGNSLDLVLDGKSQPFSEGVTATREQSDDAVVVQIEGRDDPIHNAIDDETSVYLTLTLDGSAVDQLAQSSPVRIHGTTSRAHNDGTFTESFEPKDGHADGVKSVLLQKVCFCIGVESEQESFDGTLSLERLGDKRLHVTTSLTFDWDQTFSSGDPQLHHGHLDADVIASNR